jgi:uncharacterized membrane protein YqjE
MLAIVVSMVRTRLNLLAIEIMEEKGRIWLLLLLTALSLLFAFMALLTLSLLVVVAFWEQSRLLAIGCLLAFHVAATLVTGFILWRKARLAPRLFASTLQELAKDTAALEEDRGAEDIDFDFARGRDDG